MQQPQTAAFSGPLAQRAAQHRLRRNFARAAECYERALEQNAANDEAHFGLALCAMEAADEAEFAERCAHNHFALESAAAFAPAPLSDFWYAMRCAAEQKTLSAKRRLARYHALLDDVNARLEAMRYETLIRRLEETDALLTDAKANPYAQNGHRQWAVLGARYAALAEGFCAMCGCRNTAELAQACDEQGRRCRAKAEGIAAAARAALEARCARQNAGWRNKFIAILAVGAAFLALAMLLTNKAAAVSSLLAILVMACSALSFVLTASRVIPGMLELREDLREAREEALLALEEALRFSPDDSAPPAG
jgi:tetratricopeptide (TPR) repeat protein